MANDVVRFKYDLNVMTSYQQVEHIEQTYGDKVVRIDEVRDSRGYLKEFKVELSPGTVEIEQDFEYQQYLSDLEYDEALEKEPLCLTCGDDHRLCTCFDDSSWDWDY